MLVIASRYNYARLVVFVSFMLTILIYYYATVEKQKLRNTLRGRPPSPAHSFSKAKFSGSKCTISTPTYWANTELRVDRLLDEYPFDNPPTEGYLGFAVSYDEWRIVKEPRLEVLVMPHSHIDPGYRLTFAEVYRAKASAILSSAVSYLSAHPDVTFQVAEMSILEMWWRNHGAEKREAFKRLVANGQLEILTGGWVMADEANTHYFGLVMQLLEGHEWLRNHVFLPPPTVSHQQEPSPPPPLVNHWNIDSFGLSPTMAYLLGKAGIRQGVATRVSYALKSRLAIRRHLEFRWRQLWTGNTTGLYSIDDFLLHLLPLVGFHVFDTCGVDNTVCCGFNFATVGQRCELGIPGNVRAIDEHNVEERANTLVDQLRKKAQLYQFNTLLIPWGEDNAYANETIWTNQHENLGRLFAYINSNPQRYNMHIGFGTVRSYFEKFHQRLQHSEEGFPPTLSGDFFPYAPWKDNYWVGYFTTRPFHKQLARVLEHLLRTADILYTFVSMAATAPAASNNRRNSSGNGSTTVYLLPPPLRELYPRLVEARRTVGLMQHHDSITGTTRVAIIMEDYAYRMLVAINSSLLLINRASDYLLTRIDEERSGGEKSDDDEENERELRNNSSSAKESRGLSADLDFIGVKVPQQRVLQPGTELVLFNSLAHKRVEVVCVLVPLLRPLATTDGTGSVARVKSPQMRIYELSRGARRLWRPLFRQQLEPLVELAEGKLTLANDKQKLCFQARLPAIGFRRLHLDYYGHLHHTQQVEDALGVKLYYKGDVILNNISAAAADQFMEETNEENELKDTSTTISLSNTRMALAFDRHTGHLAEMTRVSDSNTAAAPTTTSNVRQRVAINISFVRYAIESGTEGESSPSSYLLIDGPVRKSMVLKPAGAFPLMHTVELDADSDSPTIHNLIDLSAYPQVDVEVAMRLKSTPEMPDFYTQLNAHQFIRRGRMPKMPLAAHFFPMPGGVFIEGPAQRLSLLGRQPLGTASLEPGWIEVMLDRRLTGDDQHDFVGGLLDNRPTKSSFRLMLEEFSSAASTASSSPEEKEKAYAAYPSLRAHQAALQLQYPVVVQYRTKSEGNEPLSFDGSDAAINTKTSAVEVDMGKSLLGPEQLPCDVHMVALRTMSAPTEYNNHVNNDKKSGHADSGAAVNNDDNEDEEFISLRTDPLRAAAVILHRAGLEHRLIPAVDHPHQEGEEAGGCLQNGMSRCGGGIRLVSLFAASTGASTGGQVQEKKDIRVAEASLTLLRVTKSEGSENENAEEDTSSWLNPMEIKSWLLEF